MTYRICSGRAFLAEKEAAAYSKKIGIGTVLRTASGNYIVMLEENEARCKLDSAYESYRKSVPDVFIQIER